MSSSPPKAVFFAKVSHPEILERHEFYATDLRILRELGFDVIICTKAWPIPKADLYYVWWWTWAFLPWIRAKVAGTVALAEALRGCEPEFVLLCSSLNVALGGPGQGRDPAPPGHGRVPRRARRSSRLVSRCAAAGPSRCWQCRQA